MFQLTASVAAAQSRWSWPERSENLEVLPADLDAGQLRSTMVGFVRALGVRCSHCHVGEEGQPLLTYDFASDANPNKDRAREMLRMLGSIDEHLARIEPAGDEPVDVGCHTCHRGVARPVRLRDALVATWRDEGTEAALARYHQLRERYYGRGAYDFGEGSLDAVGHTLLGAGDVDGALEMFATNAQMHPDSARAWSSLASAHLEAGHTDEAIELYRKALDLDPSDRTAAQKLEELQSE